MFVDRGDGRCRRFINGTSIYKTDTTLIPGATVEFKRWAKLEAHIRTRKAVSLKTVSCCEKRFNNFARLLDVPCKWLSWKRHRPSRVLENYFDGRYIPRWMKASAEKIKMDGLLLTVYNHGQDAKTIHFELKVAENKQPIFHRSIHLEPGWNEHLLDCIIPDDGKEIWLQVNAECRNI